MTQTTIHPATLQNIFASIILSEPTLKTYVIRYRYAGCSNFFEKEIAAETEAEAVADAKSFVMERNAEVAGKQKAGNYIDICFVRDYQAARNIAAINF